MFSSGTIRSSPYLDNHTTRPLAATRSGVSPLEVFALLCYRETCKPSRLRVIRHSAARPKLMTSAHSRDVGPKALRRARAFQLPFTCGRIRSNFTTSAAHSLSQWLPVAVCASTKPNPPSAIGWHMHMVGANGLRSL